MESVGAASWDASQSAKMSARDDRSVRGLGSTFEGHPRLAGVGAIEPVAILRPNVPPIPAEVVHRIHDRYLVEVVEGLGLCPFARRSRELGRVHRPLMGVKGDTPGPHHCAEALGGIVREHADAEIVLLTFVDLEHRFDDPSAFDRFVVDVRDAYAQLDAPLFFMVGFHPELPVPDEGSRRLTKDTLVALIRRAPDPVIQCVRADVLERARSQAQHTAHQRLLATLGADPVLRAMIENSVQADSELSADIARTNFAAVGAGDGRARLEALLGSIRAERDAAYADFVAEPIA
jgi:hypothetical protein